MKELSIEQKAKAYDKALVIAKSRYSIETEESVKICLELMFPELKESADDIMRKMAIKAVYAPEAQSCIKSWGINPDDVIAWLEKQGEQKETLCDKCRREQPSHSCQDITELGRCALEHQSKQNPAWSEEDEEMIVGLNNCLDELEEVNGWQYTYVNKKDVELYKIRNWLKSLKERMKGEIKP